MIKELLRKSACILIIQALVVFANNPGLADNSVQSSVSDESTWPQSPLDWPVDDYGPPAIDAPTSGADAEMRLQMLVNMHNRLDDLIRINGPHHVQVAFTGHSLGHAFASTGRYPEAIRTGKDVLPAFQANFGYMSKETGCLTFDLAEWLDLSGDHAAAEPYREREVKIAKLLQSEHKKSTGPSVAACLSNLGITYLGERKYQLAESAFKERVQIEPKNSIGQADAWMQVGCAQLRMKIYDASKDSFQEALNMVPRNNAFEEAKARLGIAAALFGKGNASGSENIFTQAIELARGSNNNLLVANAIHMLASLYKLEGQPEKEKSLLATLPENVDSNISRPTCGCKYSPLWKTNKRKP